MDDYLDPFEFQNIGKASHPTNSINSRDISIKRNKRLGRKKKEPSRREMITTVKEEGQDKGQ